MKSVSVLLGAAVALLALLASAPPHAPPTGVNAIPRCVPSGPEYYQIELVPTSNVPGTQRGIGYVDVTYGTPATSTVSVAPDGSYDYRLELNVSDMNPAREGDFVAWVAPPNLDTIEPLGRLDDDLTVTGRVSFNKFLVILTLEPKGEELGEKWRGPIVMRGMSRSGMMHTMIGHGPLQEEPCAAFGFR